MIMAYSLQAGIPVLASSVFGIGCSVLVGLVNGILITTLNIPPFIITLGMANIVKGIILVMSEGYICSLSEPLIINIGQGTVGPVPIMVNCNICIYSFANCIWKSCKSSWGK